MKKTPINQHYYYFPRISGKYHHLFITMLQAYFARGQNAKTFQYAIDNVLWQFKEDHSIKLFTRYDKLRAVPKFIRILENQNDTDTMNFLLKRAVTIYLIFVQEFDAEKVRDILINRSVNSENYKLTYFDHNLKIHFPISYELDEVVQLVRTYLINPIHGLSSKDLKMVKDLIDTFSEFEIEIIQEFSPSMV